MTNYKQNLKQLLLDYVCQDCAALDAYINLILANLATPKKEGLSGHHVIPLGYYEKQAGLVPSQANRAIGSALSKQDKNNFIVYLAPVDHIKAHCYLALASRSCWFTFLNMQAITLLGCKNNDPEYLLAHLENDTKVVTKNRCWVNKNGQYKNISTAELVNYLNSGWQLGAAGKTNGPKSEATKERKVWMHQEAVSEKVKISALLEKLSSGWSIGRAGTRYSRQKCYVNDGNKSKLIHIDELKTYLESGYQYGKNK